jgi:hypothetical protein
MSFIAGPYTAQYNGGDNIGRTENGFRIRVTVHEEPIRTDDGGDSIIDGVNRGADTIVELDYVEYEKIKAAMFASGPVAEGAPLTNVGKLCTSLAKALVLTPVAGTTATGTYTFHKALVRGDINILLASRLKKGPLSFLCYPDPANSNKAYTVS